MVMSTRTRNRLPASAFAYPRTRKFPLTSVKQARNALARAAQKKTSGSYAHVARAVRRRFGDKVASVGRKRGTVTRPGYRRGATRRSGRRR
jgi:hypothetical protein